MEFAVNRSELSELITPTISSLTFILFEKFREEVVGVFILQNSPFSKGEQQMEV